MRDIFKIFVVHFSKYKNNKRPLYITCKTEKQSKKSSIIQLLQINHNN